MNEVREEIRKFPMLRPEMDKAEDFITISRFLRSGTHKNDRHIFNNRESKKDW